MSDKELVERDKQLLQLQSLFAECVGNRGGVAIIAGPTACGKTALLHRFLDGAAEAGASVLAAAASENEQVLLLGVIDQLFQSADLPPDEAATVHQLLEDMVSENWRGPTRLQEHNKAQIQRSLSKALLKLSADAPLVIAVDDADFTDQLSQQCLASLVRRLRGTRVMVVLIESTARQLGNPQLRAELRADPHERLIQLEPLSAHGTAELLARHPDLFPDSRAAEAHRVTGGNPLLLHALIADVQGADSAARADGLVLGERYAEAVRTCLYRSGDAAPRIAQGLAVLGENADHLTLARLLDTSATTVSRTLDQLNRAGVLDNGGFRHCTARCAVVAGTDPDDYAVLHAKAAHLAHTAGEPAVTVSRHLIHADRIETAWAVTALVEAAEQALAHGDLMHALACLRAAAAAGGSQRQQDEIVAMTVRAKWWNNPGEALPFLPDLESALRQGSLDARYAPVCVTILLWHGRVSQAVEILDMVCEADEIAPTVVEGIGSAVLLLAMFFPGHTERVRGYWQKLARKCAVAETLSHRSARALSSVLAGRSTAEAVAEAELVLHRVRLSDETMVPAMAALSTLILAGATELAGFWCDTLTRAASGVPTWEALLQALRAEIALLHGDVAKARGDAQEALDKISPRGWGVPVGRVLTTLVLAAIEGDDYAAAAGYLAENIPGDMAQTPFGIRYVHARGAYYLATGRVGDALIDFQNCGRIATRTGLDHAGLAPWRIGAAQAHLAAGRTNRAAGLIEDQLERLSPGQDRIRGICLRVQAGTVDLKRRPELLREAIDRFKACGDWLEAARAFAGLSEALNEAGEANRARLTLRTARHIAKRCQATALLRTLYPQTAAAPETTTAFEPPATDLSEAESRVAGLAALGYTNREIAGLLFVTVSTVEQHLTRVYRKLGVSRRMDLPPGLDGAGAIGA